MLKVKHNSNIVDMDNIYYNHLFAAKRKRIKFSKIGFVIHNISNNVDCQYKIFDSIAKIKDSCRKRTFLQSNNKELNFKFNLFKLRNNQGHNNKINYVRNKPCLIAKRSININKRIPIYYPVVKAISNLCNYKRLLLNHVYCSVNANSVPPKTDKLNYNPEEFFNPNIFSENVVQSNWYEHKIHYIKNFYKLYVIWFLMNFVNFGFTLKIFPLHKYIFRFIKIMLAIIVVIGGAFYINLVGFIISVMIVVKLFEIKINKRSDISNKVRFKNVKYKLRYNKNNRKSCKQLIKSVKQALGVTEYLFPIMYNNFQLFYELDTGSKYNIMSKDFAIKHIPNYKEFKIDKQRSNNLYSVSGNKLEIEGDFNLEFYLPTVGKLNLKIIIVDNASNTFILGRSFIQQTKLGFFYDDNCKRIKIKYNYAKNLSKAVFLKQIYLKGDEIQNVVALIKSDTSRKYVAKNNVNNMLDFTILEQNKDQLLIRVINKSNIPVNFNSPIHLIPVDDRSIKLHNPEEASCYPSPTVNFDSKDCRVQRTVHHSSSVHLSEQPKVKKFSFKITPKNKSKYNLITWKRKFKPKCNIKKIKENKEQIVENKDILDEQQFLDYMEHQEAGINMNEILSPNNLSIEEISNKIKANDPYAKQRISKLIHSLQINSQHSFDCGGLNDTIPKLAIKLKRPIPKNTKPYPLSQENTEEVKSFLNLLLENNLIEHSDSNNQFGSPIFTVPPRGPDKTQLPRVVVDMRRVNQCISNGLAATLPDYYNILVDYASKSKYVSCLDMRKMYYSIRIEDESKKTGAFNIITSWGSCFTFKRAITGLVNSPSHAVSVFQKYLHINETNGEIDYLSDTLIFMDDIIIGSDKNVSLADHLSKVEKVLRRLHHIGVKISPEKCEIGIDIEKEGINVLGFRIQNSKISMPEKSKNKIIELCAPTNLKQLQSLLGKLNFFRSLYPLRLHFYLNVLYKKLFPFKWDIEAQLAFDKIIEILKTTICEVSCINKSAINILFSDSSAYAIGGVLLNVDFKEWLSSQPIKSYKFESSFSCFEKQNIEYIELSNNLVECLYKTANSLNYKLMYNDLHSFTNQIYSYCQLEFNFKHFIDTDLHNSSFINFQSNIFNTTYDKYDGYYVIKNYENINYLLCGASRLLNSRVTIIDSKGKSLSVGSQDTEIVIFVHSALNEFYGLNIIESKNFLKTELRFSNDMLESTDLKDVLIKMIKTNTYEKNKKYIQIVGYFSKSISLGILDKLGICYLELLAVYSSLIHFERYISNKITFVLTDNSVVNTVLKRESIIKKSTKMDRIAQKCLGWFSQSEIYFIYCKENFQLADIWSRLVKIEESTFEISKRNIYQDENITISPLNIPERIKHINQTIHFSSLPQPGNFFSKKFTNFFQTTSFINEQIRELNEKNELTDILPHTIKYINNKIFLPKKFYMLFICFFHYSIGHLGVERLNRYVNNYYYIKHKTFAKLLMSNITANCLGCLQSKQLTHKLKSGSSYLIKAEKEIMDN